MNYKELLTAIDKAKKTQVWVRLSTSEGEYFNLAKTNVREVIKEQKWWLVDENEIHATLYKGVLKIG